jgi:hypothetical protein
MENYLGTGIAREALIPCANGSDLAPRRAEIG